MTRAAPARFLALGDSYTVGEGVATSEAWPARVAAALQAEGIALGAPHIIARTGWTTEELWAGMDAADPSPQPSDLVSLLIGVNDQYRGRSVDEYEARYAHLLARALALAGGAPGHLLCLSIPDWGVTRFAREQARDHAAIAAQLDACNATARRQAEAIGATWIDLTTISRQCGEQARMLASDGLHPSARQHALWARRIAPTARAMLTGQEPGR